MKTPTTFSKLVTIGRARVPRILLLGVAVLATTIVITPFLGPAKAFAGYSRHLPAVPGRYRAHPDRLPLM